MDFLIVELGLVDIGKCIITRMKPNPGGDRFGGGRHRSL